MPLTRPNDPIESNATADPGAEVIIRHPGYDDDPDPLIILAGYDHDGEKKGLHFGTALLICSVLSGRSDGYLTAEQNGGRLTHSADSLLEEGTYYYQVPDDPQYPIYLSFGHWRFPHDDLPQAYTHSAPSSSLPGALTLVVTNSTPEIMTRDKRCVVSRRQDLKEKAHLCPRQEKDWFEKNHMRSYIRNQYPDPDDAIDHPTNAVALRKELHTAFDQKVFVFVMKENTWTTHFLRPTYEFGEECHNMSVTISPGVSTQFLFARLAWAIFPLVKQFLVSGLNRWVTMRSVDKTGRTTWVREYLHSTSISAHFTRTPSPNKRQRGEQGGRQDDDEVAQEENSTGSTISELNEDLDTEDDTCIIRGRSKRRRGSYGSQSSLGSVSRIFPPKSILQTQESPLARSEISVTRLPSRRGSVAARAASEPELDWVPSQESEMDDQGFDAYISSLRSQAIKACRPKKRRLHRCHYQDAEDEVEFQKRESPPEDGGEDVGRRWSEECQGLETTQGQLAEATFGKGCRDEAWSLSDGLPASKDIA